MMYCRPAWQPRSGYVCELYDTKTRHMTDLSLSFHAPAPSLPLVLTFDFKTQRARFPRESVRGRHQRCRVHRQGPLILFDLAFLAARPESAIFFLDGLGDGSLGLTARVGAGGVARALLLSV